jgi:hypothetical protein
LERKIKTLQHSFIKHNIGWVPRNILGVLDMKTLLFRVLSKVKFRCILVQNIIVFYLVLVDSSLELSWFLRNKS